MKKMKYAKKPPAIPQMVACPECKVLVRVDQLKHHRARVHTESAPSSHIMTAPPGKRICPVCKEYVPIESWKKHFKKCQHLHKLQARPEVLYHSRSTSQEASRPIYVTDEFGVVHTYKEWFENETMGEHTEVKPVSKKIYPRRPEPRTFEYTEKEVVHPETTFPKKKESVKCDICGAQVLPHNLEKHKANVHLYSGKNKKQIPSQTEQRLAPNMDSIAIPLEQLDEKTQVKISRKLKENRGARVKQLARMKASIDPTEKQSCPFCMKAFSVEELPKHIDQKHAGKFKSRSTSQYHPVSGKQQSIKNQSHHPYTETEKTDIILDESLDMDEPRDGSKYLGHFKREGGQFGSYPLHDDYSDESDAE
jgi:hypothetical protein